MRSLPARVTGSLNVRTTSMVCPGPYNPSGVADVMDVTVPPYASTTISLISARFCPAGRVRSALFPPTSCSVAPIRLIAVTVRSTLDSPAATVYVPLTVLESANGVIVTIPPESSVSSMFPPVSATLSEKFIVTSIGEPVP